MREENVRSSPQPTESIRRSWPIDKSIRDDRPETRWNRVEISLYGQTHRIITRGIHMVHALTAKTREIIIARARVCVTFRSSEAAEGETSVEDTANK